MLSLLLCVVACKEFSLCPVPALRKVSQANPYMPAGAETGHSKAPACLGK